MDHIAVIAVSAALAYGIFKACDALRSRSGA